MKLQFATLLATTFTTLTVSCQNPEEESSFAKQLTQLNEFRIEEKRADSLKRKGADFEFIFSIAENSPFPEDSLKNLSVGFIQYDFGPDELMLYKVKYDKGKGKIVSVEKTYTEVDLIRYGLIKVNKKL